MNYEDVEQGADHDMDAIAIYEYTLNTDKSVDIKVTSEYAAGSLIQHMGYVISGTNGTDGTYFVIRDTDTTSGDPDYYLDTPDTFKGQPPAKDTVWNLERRQDAATRWIAAISRRVVPLPRSC